MSDCTKVPAGELAEQLGIAVQTVLNERSKALREMRDVIARLLER